MNRIEICGLYHFYFTLFFSIIFYIIAMRFLKFTLLSKKFRIADQFYSTNCFIALDPGVNLKNIFGAFLLSLF
jgi:hypothetical protein